MKQKNNEMWKAEESCQVDKVSRNGWKSEYYGWGWTVGWLREFHDGSMPKTRNFQVCVELFKDMWHTTRG